MIVSVEQIHTGRSGTRERKGWRALRTYRREYQVIADAEEDESSVLLATDLPFINSFHPTDIRARCNRLSCDVEPDEINVGAGHFKWTVKAEWTTEKDQSGESPLYPDTPARVSWGWDRKEIPIQKDRDDKAIANTAKDPYDPPVMIEFPIPVKTIQINLAEGEYSQDWANTYFLTVNDATFLGWPRDCVLVQDISATSEIWTDEDDNDIPYWSVTIKLAFNALKWQPNVLSQGLRELWDDGGTIKKRPIRTSGRDITSPLPLDVNGHAITGDNLDDAHFDEYYVYFRKDLTVFDV